MMFPMWPLIVMAPQVAAALCADLMLPEGDSGPQPSSAPVFGCISMQV